jgi:hypothetical protein
MSLGWGKTGCYNTTWLLFVLGIRGHSQSTTVLHPQCFDMTECFVETEADEIPHPTVGVPTVVQYSVVPPGD